MKILVINPLFEMIPELLEQLNNQKVDFDIICYKSSEKKYFKDKGIKIYDLKKELKKISFSKFEVDKEHKIYTKEYNEILYKNSFEKKVDETSEKFKIFLKKIQKENQYTSYLLVNGSYLFEKIAYSYAKIQGIKTINFEYGYFRPYTFTMDWQGVNINNSVPREEEFYLNLVKDNRAITDIEYAKKIPKKSIYKKPLMEIIKENILGNGYTTDFRISYYNLFKVLTRLKNLKEYKNVSEKFEIPNEYIFVSFQLEADSQIILNSPNIKKMKDLYDGIIKEVEKYNKLNNEKIKIIFKIHPLDRNLNLKEFSKNENVILTRVGDIKELIQKSKIVIVINSTVGIEALIEGKKVITLGDAFYNISNLVERLEINQIANNLKSIFLKEQKHKLRENFLWYLRFKYFKEIYYKEPCTGSLNKIIEEIKKEG